MTDCPNDLQVGYYGEGGIGLVLVDARGFRSGSRVEIKVFWGR